MKIILIDDEYLSLNFLEKLLLKMENAQIVGKYMDSFEGREAILQEDVDVVFLDIHMPEVNGIELAEQLLEKKPKLQIVFVTAHDDYAVQAFELNALDYLLKPFGTERLLKTWERIKDRADGETQTSVSSIQPIHIKMLQHLSIEVEDHQSSLLRWRTSSAQELFLYLLQYRGKLVRKSVIVDLLWPDADMSKAYSQLYTTVYLIRKVLQRFEPHIKLENVMDGYILNLEKAMVDVDEWEMHISALPSLSDETIDEYEKALAAYTGDYLQDYEYWWAESERHRLKMLWQNYSFQIANSYVEMGQEEKAIAKYLDVCNRYPQEEEAHFELMKLYASLNNSPAVHRQYQALATVLENELDERPSQMITDWYLQWKQEKKE
ncbi:response regulator [Brevibacillus choshinensis]|uniref:Response regulator n=1 Tax=Brevibacillus choshinensis TaxID=54911 RepID=A0ABX7FJH8_BRECH|nr:response regulator [Brevibacillus choshinensis]QRG66287.1 response regulator [Brevibacillus choshinensis]